MGLSRKRKKQLKKLKKTAYALWEEQQKVLAHAGEVGREAGRQVDHYSREEVAPRVKNAYDDNVAPVIASSYSATKAAAKSARKAADRAQKKVVHDVLPQVSSNLAAAIAGLEVSKDPRVRELVKHVQKTSDSVSKNAKTATKNAKKGFAEVSKKSSDLYDTVGKKAGFVKPKPKPAIGVGGWVLIVLGVIAVAGIAYAAWQTLRADDELWVLDEKDEPEA